MTALYIIGAGILYFIWLAISDYRKKHHPVFGRCETQFDIRADYLDDWYYKTYDKYLCSQIFYFTNDYGRTWTQILDVSHPYKGVHREDFFSESIPLSGYSPMPKKQIMKRFPSASACIKWNTDVDAERKRKADAAKEKRRIAAINERYRRNEIKENLKKNIW